MTCKLDNRIGLKLSALFLFYMKLAKRSILKLIKLAILWFFILTGDANLT